MRWWWCLAVVGLTACDVAPSPIDYTAGQVQTADAAYQLFVDGAVASSMAKKLAAACDGYAHDLAAENRYRSFFDAEFKRLLADDPDVARELLRRLGFYFPPGPLPIKSFNDIKGRDVSTGYLLTNPGLTFDVGSRAIASVLRQGGDASCAAAEREITQGTLAGSFLKPAF